MKDEKGGPMKDLDFDELHEAVNKLMDQAQKSKTKREPAKSAAKAVSRPSVKVAERAIKDDKPEPAAAKPEIKPTPAKDDSSSPISITVRKTAKVTPKKRGMAMDVVQAPKANAVAPPSARAARTAPTLQPTGPVRIEPPSPRAAGPASMAEPPVASVPAAPTPNEAPRESHDVSEDMLASLDMQTDGDAKPKTIIEDDHVSEFPDPLEVHGFSDDTKKDSDEDQKTRHHIQPDESAVPSVSPAPAMEHSTAPIAPVAPAAQHHDDDPLLKDDDHEPATKNQWEMPHAAAKEEAPTVTPDDEPVPTTTPAPEPAATPFVNAKVEKRPLGAYAGAAPAPAAHVQTDDEPRQPAEEKSEPIPVMPPAPEELNPEVVAVESADVDYSAPSQSKESEAPLNTLRQMSIPQQYHPGSKEPNKQDRPIFDTKDYHPPIHPVATAKHHTGSKAGAILTLILIILLVAAGVGAYFVATGSIDITRLF